MQAVKTCILQIAAKEEADDLAENDALIKRGTEKVYVIGTPADADAVPALATV